MGDDRSMNDKGFYKLWKIIQFCQLGRKEDPMKFGIAENFGLAIREMAYF